MLSGVLRGCGKQLPVAVINICCYYLLGLPMSLALVYAADMGAFGFWIGCTVSSVIQVRSYVMSLYAVLMHILNVVGCVFVPPCVSD